MPAAQPVLGQPLGQVEIRDERNSSGTGRPGRPPGKRGPGSGPAPRSPTTVGGDLVQAVPPVRFGRPGLTFGHLLEEVDGQGVALGGDDQSPAGGRGSGPGSSDGFSPAAGAGVLPAHLLQEDRGRPPGVSPARKRRGRPSFWARWMSSWSLSSAISCSTSALKTIWAGRTPVCPASTAVSKSSVRPRPAAATVGTTGTPRSSESFPVSMLVPLRCGLVHHVQGHHQGPLQAHQLQGELQAAAQKRGVDDVDDDVDCLR